MVDKYEEIKSKHGDIEVGYWADPYGSYNEWFGFVDRINVKKGVKPTMERKANKNKSLPLYYIDEVVVSLK